MVKAKAYILQKRFEGVPKPSDLKIIEEDLPPIKNGEFLSEAVFLSVDPYQRAYAPNLEPGTVLIGSQVAKVIESKNPKYPVGQYVVGEFGWRTHTVSDGSQPPHGFPAPWLIPDPQGLPLSLSLGILGMPGITSYYGFLDICQPKSGETVVVTGAAGAVGSIVGQLAKIKNCTVIGVTGSNEKGQRLIDEYKFDHYLNYKDQDFEQKLGAVTPNGIDCYFDNVGGEISTIIISKMNPYGRISVCGSISGYNDTAASKANSIQWAFVVKQLKMEGFIFMRWWKNWYDGLKEIKKLIKDGKLQYRETVTEGFDNMFTAFVEMLEGKNYGKAIIKV